MTTDPARKPMTEGQRVALVTGSTSGIGQAIAQRLAAEGYAIAFHSKTSQQQGQVLAASLPSAMYVSADLAETAQAQALVQQVLDHYGRLDVLVNNAGETATIPHGDLKAATPAIWHRLYGVNVVAPWVLVTAAEAALKQSASNTCPSCIVNISSHAGIRPKGASVPYAVSKAALNHMTKLLAVTLAPLVRVNAIAPGLVHTPMSQHWTAAQQLWETRSPMARGAQPEDIAQIALSLIESTYLTGEVLLADGGLNLT